MKVYEINAFVGSSYAYTQLFTNKKEAVAYADDLRDTESEQVWLRVWVSCADGWMKIESNEMLWEADEVRLGM